MPFLHLDDARLFYRSAGDGPLALFVHGFPFDSRMWLDQVDGLADVRRCVAIDLRGSGQSSPYSGEDLTMEDQAADVAAVIGALGEESADVIGLSMGGYVSLALLEAHPDLVRSITLIDTKSASDDEAGRAGRDAAKEKLLSEGRAAFATGMLDVLLAPGSGPRMRARIHDMIEATPHETIVAALEGMKRRPDRRDVLADASCPVLVIVGEHDQLTPPEIAKEMADLVGTEAKVVPGAGHMSPLEQPIAVNAALRMFLGRLTPPTST